MKEHIVPPSGELLDVADQYGEPTGQALPKEIIHSLGLRHRDVHVWVTNGLDLLQQQRTWDKEIMPGDWDISVGGHVASGETYVEAAVRETKEELGLGLNKKEFRRIGLVASRFVVPGWEYPHTIIGDNFVIYQPDLQLADLQLQRSEVLGARWHPIDQLERDLMDADTAKRHAPQPQILYALGIAGMRGVSSHFCSL